MGDRAVYGFKSDGHTLFLYAQWGGADQLITMQEAIRKAEPRWKNVHGMPADPAYATRIATSHIIGDDWARETGYGLSIDTFCQPDYDYAYVVDWDAQTVETIDTWQETGDTTTGPVVTFATFLAYVNAEA